MNVGEADKLIVAAFDFDGTLTQRDTLLPFLLHVVGWAVFIRNLFVLAPTLIGYVLGMIRNDIAKERVLNRFLSGMSLADLQKKTDQFAEFTVPKLLRPEAMQRFGWHKEQRHRCVVISASLELYLRPWAIKAGFDNVIATHLDIQKDGLVTGKLAGKNCHGAEKAKRLEILLGRKDGYTLYAYGDSKGDAELLSLADFAYYRKFS